MAVTIKHLNMPKNCAECAFRMSGYPDWCDMPFTGGDINNTAIRPSWCPLVEAEPMKDEWIPCGEGLPRDLEPINITWVNHRPMTYYAQIKDEPFTGTAIHYKDKWWWYSPICEDLLAEYGKSECDKMDAAIEVLAWMPLPKPYNGERREDEIN